MTWGLQHGMSNFEVDFMDFSFLLQPQFQQNVVGGIQWLRGMADAAKDMQVPIQYCMALPSDILASLQFPWVTNARASDDYVTTTNWNIGGSSLLYWSVDIRPSKDTFWTTPNQPGNVYNRNLEFNPLLTTMEAIMSCGPVGFGDKIGYTDADLIKRTCAEDGLLLQPSKPLTSIDAMYSIGKRALTNGSVWTSFSEEISKKQVIQQYMLAIDVAQSFVLVAEDFWPNLDKSKHWVYRTDSQDMEACTNGSSAFDRCVTLLNDYPDMQTGPINANGTKNYELWTFSVRKNGWALLGELDKIVNVSPKRFYPIEYSDNTFGFGVHGSPGEIVHVWVVNPHDTIVQVDLLMPESGHLTEWMTK